MDERLTPPVDYVEYVADERDWTCRVCGDAMPPRTGTSGCGGPMCQACIDDGKDPPECYCGGGCGGERHPCRALAVAANLAVKCGACGALSPAIVSDAVVYTWCTLPKELMEDCVEYPASCRAALEGGER